MTTTVGSLCSGYAGLDLAAERITGGTTVWHCEYDDAPSALLAARFPGVPNHRDLKTLAWADHPVDVLTAGYPCQPFSGAGKRLGTHDPRHLFPFIARGVERMRPALLLLENVRGHLTLGFDVVLAELDRIGYDARWSLLRAADVGAPHGRARLWIACRDRQRGGWPAPLGHPTAHADGQGGWQDPQAGLFGDLPAVRPGTAGTMVDGQRWDSEVPGWHGGLLPTPRATRGGSHSETRDLLMPTPRTTDTNGPGAHGSGGPDLRTVVSLLPTPSCADASGGHANRSGDRADELLLPGVAKALAKGQLLPTPTTQPHTGNGHARDLGGQAKLLSTPLAADGGGERASSAGWGLRDESRSIATSWGPYAAAVARWEHLTRPAPAPTEQGRTGPRLSPAFVEWMQGLPAGWVTGADLGLTRNQQLTMLGNGVVPQCAEAAFGLLLADLLAVAA